MNEMIFDRIVLNVPHSSTERYGEGWNGCFGMFPTVKRWTDWHTDVLFMPRIELTDRVKMVRFPYSRFFCDVERLLFNEPLEKVGQGVVYTDFEGFTRKMSDVEKMNIITDYYMPHINKIRDMIMEGRNSILIDCHSFPSDLSDIDVCIGFNEDWSKPNEKIIEMVCDRFAEKGLKVGINDPYSNSLSPTMYRKDYSSFMIEVNKRTYMNEDTLELDKKGFETMQRIISGIYLSLL